MTIKLSDFGFAKELDEGETLTGEYISPPILPAGEKLPGSGA